MTDALRALRNHILLARQAGACHDRSRGRGITVLKPDRGMTVRQHLMRVASIALIAAAAAACGGGAPSQAPTAIPNAASSPNPSSPTVSGESTATLTLGNFGEADGPGEPVRDAIANAGVEPRLVNGILLRHVDGKVWLCEALRDVSPPDCAAPRLLVQNWLSGDQAFAPGQGAHEANGVRWVEKVQLFGVVRP
jgi:hypothetical protein